MNNYCQGGILERVTRFDIEVIRATWLPFLGATGVFACLGGPLTTLVAVPSDIPFSLPLLGLVVLGAVGVVGQVFPLLLAIGVWVGLTRLKLEGDWTGWLSLGVSPRRLLVPVLGLAVGGMICFGAWLHLIQPRLLGLVRTQLVAMSLEVAQSHLAEGKVIQLGQRWRLFPSGEGRPLVAAEYHSPAQIRWWTSRSLTLLPEGVITLNEGEVPTGAGEVLPAGLLHFTRAEVPIHHISPTRTAAALTWDELGRRIREMTQQGRDTSSEKLNFYQRFTLPILCLPLLLGAAISVFSGRKVGDSFAWLVGLITLTLTSLRLSEIAVAGAWLPPGWAAWMPIPTVCLPFLTLSFQRFKWS